MGGKALTATELALEADITPPTASSHLQKLVEGQLLIVHKQGRHKYFQLQGSEVAELLESLLSISASLQSPGHRTGPSDPRLHQARVCYNHLAGELGVALYDSLCAQQLITPSPDNSQLTDAGREFFQQLGADFDQLKPGRRPLCKACLDWSERRSHLAGVLGQWILDDLFASGWAERELDSRAVRFSERGMAKFLTRYGIDR